MNKKYIDTFYNDTLQNELYEPFSYSLPMTLLYRSMFQQTETYLKETYDLLSSEVDVLAALYCNGFSMTPTRNKKPYPKSQYPKRQKTNACRTYRKRCSSYR